MKTKRIGDHPARRRLFFSMLGLLTSSVVAAQDQGRVVVDVGECLELDDRTSQLECYEARVADALESGESAESELPARAGATPRAIRDESARSPERSSGPVDPDSRPDSRAPEAGATRRDAEVGVGEAIEATVTSVRELEPNNLLVELDNGQVWRQNRPRRFILEVGTPVRLEPTNWGPAYRLSVIGSRGFIQVQRVR